MFADELKRLAQLWPPAAVTWTRREVPVHGYTWVYYIIKSYFEVHFIFPLKTSHLFG